MRQNAGQSMLTNLLSNTDFAADLLGALANPRRLHILCLLTEGEHSVGALADKVDLSQSALSQHLAKLRAQQIVSTRRHGQTIYYSLTHDGARELIGRLDGLMRRATS